LTVDLKVRSPTGGDDAARALDARMQMCRDRCLKIAEVERPLSVCSKAHKITIVREHVIRELVMYASKRFAHDGDPVAMLLAVAIELRDLGIGLAVRGGVTAREPLTRGEEQLAYWQTYDASGACLMLCAFTTDATHEKRLIEGLHAAGLGVLSSVIAGERGGVGDLYIQVCPALSLPTVWPTDQAMEELMPGTQLAVRLIKANKLGRIKVNQVIKNTSAPASTVRAVIHAADPAVKNGAIVQAVTSVVPLDEPLDIVLEVEKRRVSVWLCVFAALFVDTAVAPDLDALKAFPQKKFTKFRITDAHLTALHAIDVAAPATAGAAAAATAGAAAA
jgi:hypothetical protein